MLQASGMDREGCWESKKPAHSSVCWFSSPPPECTVSEGAARALCIVYFLFLWVGCSTSAFLAYTWLAGEFIRSYFTGHCSKAGRKNSNAETLIFANFSICWNLLAALWLSVQLVVKVHMNDNSTKSLMVDERQLARDVLDNLFEKTHCDCNVDWCLYEIYPELQIGKSLPGNGLPSKSLVGLLYGLWFLKSLVQGSKTSHMSQPLREIRAWLFISLWQEDLDCSRWLDLEVISIIITIFLLDPQGKECGRVIPLAACLGSSAACGRAWVSVSWCPVAVAALVTLGTSHLCSFPSSSLPACLISDTWSSGRNLAPERKGQW